MESGKKSNDMQELYNSWKTAVWVLRIQYTKGDDEYTTFGTAFSVNSYGLILTTAHSFPKTSCEIHVRRLNEANFHLANVVFEKPKWDVVLLQVADVKCCQYARLSNDNSLLVGQTLLHIGHPHNFVGSFLVGKVAFECMDQVQVPRNNATCKTYIPTALTTTPRNRIMGDVWNAPVLGCCSSSDRSSFEKNLHPFIPIIQMYGLICGVGSSGGPVFNVEGEVVGMMTMTLNGYQIAIHVAILREILRLFKDRHQDDKHGKGKDIPDPEVQGGDSKKFKAVPVDRKGKGRLAIK